MDQVNSAVDVELEDLLAVVFDGVVIAEDAISGNWMKIVGDALNLFKDIPGAVSNIGDLKSEIANLPNDPEAEQELVAFIESKFSNVAGSTAQEILAWALDIVTTLIGLIEKIFVGKKLLPKI